MREWLFICGLGLAVPAFAEKSPGGGVSDPLGAGNFMQMFVGLAIVLGVIFLMAWAIRRMGHVQTRVSGVMKVLGGLSLGQRERVVLIQVGDNQILLGVAPGQIRKLHVLDKPVETEGERQVPGQSSFAERLQQALRGRAP